MKLNFKSKVNKPIEAVWNIMGNEYADVYKWASAVHHSEGVTAKKQPIGAPCSGRECSTSLGGFKETLVIFDEKAHIISYDATGDKMPFFVRKMNNTWKLNKVDESTTEVQMELKVRLLPIFNILMAIPMKMQLGKALKDAIEEFSFYAENQKPHPRKIESVKKAS